MKLSGHPALTILLALTFPASLQAAFEPVAQSPWLQAGAASALFPRTPLALIGSPFAVGLLEGGGVAASACRPFGLRELDRCALAASSYLGTGTAAGCAVTLSGTAAYSELSVIGSCAASVFRRAVAGLSVACRRLQVSGYGTGSGISCDAGVAVSPLDGLYAAGTVRGLFRSALGESGDPACPRGMDLSLGACPGRGVTVALGASRDENHPPEFSVSAAFSPSRFISLGAAMLTGPVRFSFCLSVSVSDLALGYGYAGHERLPGSHSVSLCLGRCSSRPSVLRFDSTGEQACEPSFPLNVNTATAEDLEHIPGIGPARASSIVSWIGTEGPVESVEELIDVPGIGPAALRTLCEYLVAE
jgi:competence ComEA-like helix-hairpin-helix protein